MQTLKAVIHHALESNDLDSVVLLAKQNRKVMSHFVRMAYDKDTLVGWRAIKAAGLAAKALVATDYEYLRDLARKLLWSLSDESGGIGWSAPEILGEIVSSDPEKFSDLVPLIAEVYDIEEKVFRPGILYAFAKIADVNAALIMPHKDIIVRALSDNNALARIYALKVVKTLETLFSKDEMENIRRVMNQLKSDKAEVWVYEEVGFKSVQVKEIV